MPTLKLTKKYQRYPKYKDSGVEWIGEVPEGWNLERLKYATSLITRKISKENLHGTYVALENVESKTGRHIPSEEKVEPESMVNTFEDTDVLFGKLRPYLAKVFASDFSGTSTGEFLVLRPKNKIIKKYLFYRILSQEFINTVNDSTFGAQMPRASWSFIGNLSITLPTLGEQQKIATYLDEKTALIDAIIEKKKQQIKLLREKRAAIINRAVTKGLNPNAKLVDSGIEWIGKIPEGWEVKKLKHVGRFKSGDSITTEEIRDEGQYPVYGGNGLRGYYSEYTHEGDHVLIGRQGALCGNINYAKGKFWASEHAVVVTLFGHKSYWLGNLLSSMNIGQYSVSAAQPGLAVEKVKNLLVPVPPEQKQEDMVRFLEEKLFDLDSQEQKIKQSITLLQEFKSALISHVVTGKVKV